MCVEWDTLLGRCSLGYCHGDTEDCVGAQLGLVGRAIKLVDELVDLGLVLDIKTFLDQSWCNDVVDVGNSLGDTLASPVRLVAITELTCLVGAGGSARWDDCAVQTSLSDDVDLDSGVTTGVIDRTRVDLRDCHVVFS